MKIAAAQICCVLGDVAANVRKMRDFAAGAKRSGAELIVFPEASDTGYSMSIIQQHASAWKEGAVSELQEIAKESCIAIIAGVSEREGDSIYNSQAFIDATGAIAARYRKTHLFASEPGDESKCYTPGNTLTSYKIDNLISA
jgi:predicted amidohydrolase